MSLNSSVYHFTITKNKEFEMFSKKVITAATIVAITSTSVFAYCQRDAANSPSQKQMKQGGFHKSNHKKMGIMPLLSQLNLSSEQQQKIDTIVEQNRPQKVGVASFIKDGAFDKEGYIKAMQDQRDNRFVFRAQMIEKVLEVLNDTQKSDFQTLLKAQEIQMSQKMSKKGMKGDKSCNGRG